MATLAKTTAVLVLLACLLFGWPDAGVQGADKVDIKTLRTTLQEAIELEWATIPPYLTAALSLKDGTNTDAIETLKSILLDEMAHMALAANMLNAIGGAPVLNKKAPRYPGPLPAGVLPDLNVTLEKMTKSHTKKVFMGIETPECEDSVITFHRHLSKVAFSASSNEMFQNFEDAYPGLQDKCREVDPDFSPDTNTIGAIYIYKILCPMLDLETEGSVSIFIEDDTRQLLSPFKVKDLTTAIKAIAQIVSQGEGGDPCNPFVHPDFAPGSTETLSHYFKFAQIAKGKEIEVSADPCDECEIYFGPCEGEKCENIQFSGNEVPFNEDEVLPILPNPTTDDYPSGSDARKESDKFNEYYMDLMQCLHDAVNGKPDMMSKCISKMNDLKNQGKKLVDIPIENGLHAAPTYEFPEIRDDFPHQQQQRIEL